MIPRSEPSDSTESSSDRSHRSRDGGSAPPLPLIRESDSYLADGSARRSSWSTAAPPEAARPPGLIGHPHAVHQLGLADIQRRDPLNNLLTVGRLLQHPAPPILSGGEQQDLIRVLEATPKGPHTAPGNPARSRPPATIDTRASAGHHQFSARNGRHRRDTRSYISEHASFSLVNELQSVAARIARADPERAVGPYKTFIAARHEKAEDVDGNCQTLILARIMTGLYTDLHGDHTYH